MAQETNPFARLFTKPGAFDSSSNSTDVRFASLQPGNRHDPILITLFASNPIETSYDCISYDRSSESESVDVKVDGTNVAIPIPLENALRALRHEHRPRNLWADILTGHTPEQRSIQDAASRTILENADSIISWLGPDTSLTASAFDVLLTISNRWDQGCLHAGIGENLSLSNGHQWLAAREKVLSYPSNVLHPTNDALWKEIEAIMSSTYFKSVRSISDIVLAKETIIVMGESAMNWPAFIGASRAVFMVIGGVLQRQPSEEMKSTFQCISDIEIAQRRHRTDDGIELLPMIQSARDCSASDPREYVYAMLPITRPSKRSQFNPNARPDSPLKPDYLKSVSEVFREAARFIVHERQDLLLWWKERPPAGRRVVGLPSWVPDWSSPLPKGSPMFMPNNGLRRWTDSITSPKRISVHDDFTLHVQAHALDRVSTVSPIFTEENCRRLCLQEWKKLNWLPGRDSNEKAQGFWRTLVLDDAGYVSREQAKKPPKEMWVSFFSLIAEERILEDLGCTMHGLFTDPELQARAKSHPQMSILGQQAGKSEPFETLLRQNAIGRRLFITEGGRTGMTAIESRPTVEDSEHTQPLPNFDDALGDPIAAPMMAHFQYYLRERDPDASRVVSQALRGELPGQAAPGVRTQDIVVALVGGFQPYVLRPHSTHSTGNSENVDLLSDSKYVYVGDCYLHGVMEGEPFQERGWFYNSWKTNVDLMDIEII